MEIEVEKAKGFFILSQVLIILAGFLFTSSGVSYSYTFNSFNRAVDLVYNPQNLSANLSQQLIKVYGDITQSNIQLYLLFLIFGLFVVVFSMISWIIGYNKLYKFKQN